MSDKINSFKKISEEYAIVGAISPSELELLASEYKSTLYLALDTGKDFSIEGGFDVIKSACSGSALHVPFDSSIHANPNSVYPITAIYEYTKYSEALDSLKTPTLLICQSNRRASAVIVAYLGIKNNKDADTVIKESIEQDLKFVEVSPINNWVRKVVNTKSLANKNKLIFRSFFDAESSTYSYLLADDLTREALLIDPVYEQVERDAMFIKDMGLKFKYVVNTHVHADHITGSGLLKTRFPDLKSCISFEAGADADIKFSEGDCLEFGSRSIICISTPGHTSGCYSFVLDDFSMVFTGDVLLIRGCGRTDFQGGSSSTLYSSVKDKLFKLPGSCTVYPAHDYKGLTASSIYEEMTYNPRLTKVFSNQFKSNFFKSLNLFI